MHRPSSVFVGAREIVPAALLAVLPAVALTQGLVRVTGRFSDIHYVERAGDIVGMEIIISKTDSGYRVRFQIAEGVPGGVDTVSATVQGDSLFFELPPDTVRRYNPGGPPFIRLQQRTVRGRITATRLQGRLTGYPVAPDVAGYSTDIDLPRRATPRKSP